MTKANVPAETKQAGRPLLFLIWGVVPLLFAVAVFFVVAEVLNWNVMEKIEPLTGEIPFVSQSKDTAEELIEKEKALRAEMENTLAEKESELLDMQSKLAETAQQNEELLIEQDRLKSELTKLQREQTDQQAEFSEVIKTFDMMSAKSAAAVLTEMNETEAIRVLKQLKPDKVAAIMEKMEAKSAAMFAETMAQ